MSCLEDMSVQEKMVLQYEVEQFLYHEASLLDDRKYDDWLALLAEDIHYWMPVRRTMMMRDIDKEFTALGAMAFFDDDKEFLKLRVIKMAAGNAWSEDPPSRTRHFVTNTRILAVEGDNITTESNFHLYRARLDDDEDSWIGRRKDIIRRVEDGFELALRHIFLEQTTLTSQNMSSLF
ncbi:MAG: 3-phenylpropionate/cinnamic acid dioxygenase subunit beta [Pseudomonadales bacterium]